MFGRYNHFPLLVSCLSASPWFASITRYSLFFPSEISLDLMPQSIWTCRIMISISHTGFMRSRWTSSPHLFALWRSDLRLHMAVIGSSNYTIDIRTYEVNIIAFTQCLLSHPADVYMSSYELIWMDRRHLMYSVLKHIKDWTLVWILCISHVVPSEGVFFMFALLHLISSPHLRILSSSLSLLKWTRVLRCHGPAGRVLIKPWIKITAG